MADGDTYDYSQDPDFLKAPAQQQHAYLMKADPQYAQADPKTQGAYISHLRGYDQPTQFEQANESQVSGSALNRGLEGFGRGVENIAGGLYNTVVHPLDTARGMVSGAENEAGFARTAPTLSERIGHGVAAAMPGVGPWAAGVGGRIGQGDIAGGITEAATTLGVPEAIGILAPKIAPKAIEKASTFPLRGTIRDVASKYVSPRLADWMLKEKPEALSQSPTSMESESITSGTKNYPEPTQPSTERPGGGSMWSSKQGQELEDAAASGNRAAQDVLQRKGRLGLIIPRPTIGTR